ncbi:MAG: hypothetical protein HYR58_00615 [Acidobacteria bacterium]|nr:hypothetical protein [Acidobacteriota bacterium]
MRKIILSGMALLLMAAASVAQETPTEREAARDVVKQIQELAQTLGVQPMVAKLTAPNKQRDEVIVRVKQLMDTDLMPMSDWITKHPEIGFEEKQAVEKLTAYLKAHDFDVSIGVGELKTAFQKRNARAEPRRDRGIRRAARHEGRVPRRPAQFAGTGGPGRGDCGRRILDAHEHAGNGDGVRLPRGGDDAARIEDRDDGCGRV